MIGWLRFIVCAALFMGWPARANAVCTITGFQTTSPSTLNLGAYTVSTTPSTYVATLTVVMTLLTTGGPCKGAIALQRNTSPAQMTISPTGSSTLPYEITTIGSTTSAINFGAGAITKFIPLSSFAPPAGTLTATGTVSLSIQPKTPTTLPMAGFYVDQTLLLRGYDTFTGNAFKGQMPLAISANVASGCALTAPDSITVDFSSDIFAGKPRGLAQTTSFSVNCNAASKIYMSGSAMQPATSIPMLTGFDTQINYHALASISGASVALTTTGTTPVTSLSTTRSATGSSLPVSLTLSLVAGNRLPPATYKSVLRITVDPAL